MRLPIPVLPSSLILNASSRNKERPEMTSISSAFATVGNLDAEDVRVVKIAPTVESKPPPCGALGEAPQGYESEVLRAIKPKLPQYKFEMEGTADIAQETELAIGKSDMVTGGYSTSEALAKQFLIPEAPIGPAL